MPFSADSCPSDNANGLQWEYSAEVKQSENSRFTGDSPAQSNLAEKAVLVVPVVIKHSDLKHLMNIGDIPASNYEKLFARVMLSLTKRNSNSILVPKSWSQLVSFLSISGNLDTELEKK